MIKKILLSVFMTVPFSLIAAEDTFLNVIAKDGRLIGRHKLVDVDSVVYDLNALDNEATAEQGVSVSGHAGDYTYVDLGLPSGTKWSTYYVGAKTPYEKGVSVEWGETTEKSSHKWSTYKWSIVDDDGNLIGLTKYADTVDQKKVLDAEDDVAVTLWGENWRMPSVDEFRELYEGCDWKFVQKKAPDGNNSFGVIGTSKYNNHTIFMYTSGFSSTKQTSLWTNSLGEENESAVSVQISEKNMMFPSVSRYWGKYARAVVSSTDAVETVSSMVVNKIDGKSFAYNIDDIAEVIIEEGNLMETGTIDNYAYVDLGLPSGLKWATLNVGANSIFGYGDYFAWGEVKPKTNYCWATYKWCEGEERTLTKYNVEPKFDLGSFGSYGKVDTLSVLLPEDDAATVNWSENWRMPTKAEVDELYNNCTWVWTENYDGSGINGKVGTSKINGNRIFFPATGWIWDTEKDYVGQYDEYWTSTNSEWPDNAYSYTNDIEGFCWVKSNRFIGLPVRAVSK